MIGKQILSYKIESVLGEGGMGTVYLGVHAQLGRKVAVKMLHPNLSKNASLRERFKNEASALAHLHQPNIVTLFDYYESEESLFLVMEYVDGMELADHINKVSGPIDDKSAIHYFNQILDGFKYAHKKKVVHRDIKPSNILIDKDDDIKIMDFGIAKIMDSQKSLTKTGTQIGTVFYMSPEQVKGEKIDHRSDIYSLGITLFQMITGQSPYSNDTTEFQIYNNIVNDPLPNPASIYPGASKHLAQVITKATQKNVEDRFQSCEEFKKAINDSAFKTGIKEPTITEAPKKQIKEAIRQPAIAEGPKTEIKKPTPPKKRKKIIFILLASIALVFGGGYFYLKVNNLNFDLFANEESVPANGRLEEEKKKEITTEEEKKKEAEAEAKLEEVEEVEVVEVVEVEVVEVVEVEVEVEEEVEEREIIVTMQDQEPIEEEEVIEVEEIFEFVEQQPEFPGGAAEMYNYLGKEVKYPEMAREAGIQGKVYVKFVVKKDGSIGEVKVVRGVHKTLDREAIRAVQSMPKWTAGEQRGKKVSVWFTLPINFHIG